jgi:predicted amidohydrolase YtcJ
MSRADAVAAFTRDAAWFTGEGETRGRLVPGYDADLCVPTDDPFDCPDDALRDILSDLTVMNGRVTHESGVFG